MLTVLKVSSKSQTRLGKQWFKNKILKEKTECGSKHFIVDQLLYLIHNQQNSPFGFRHDSTRQFTYSKTCFTFGKGCYAMELMENNITNNIFTNINIKEEHLE